MVTNYLTMKIFVYTLVLLAFMDPVRSLHKNHTKNRMRMSKYYCNVVESKCFHVQMFIVEAIVKYSLAYMSRYEVNKACRSMKKVDLCLKGSGCEQEMESKIKLMKWICTNKRALFMGADCWKSDDFRKNAPICDSKIQKSCHYHKLVGTCLKSVIGRNKQCTRRQMHFYGGLLEAIDKLRNPHGRC